MLPLHLFVTASAGSPLSPRRQVLDLQRYFRTDREIRDAGLVSRSLSSLTKANANTPQHSSVGAFGSMTETEKRTIED